jgi:squalene synthase HpnC
MTDPGLASGKGHRDENFPVASALIAKRHRPAVMAFYRVARMSDDIADHATADAATKLAQLDAVERSLTGAATTVPEALALRNVLSERGIALQHALDLLIAFKRDVTQNRYADWADLLDYCRYSAAPVGRFMLDVHGEDRATWPASDALCAALQINNHLQDCAKDYRQIDRVYLPAAVLAAAGATVEDLNAPVSSPALRQVIGDLARRTRGLLDQAAPLAAQVRDRRLSLEVGVIHRMAVAINDRLLARDPLGERVHLRGWEAAGAALRGAGEAASARLRSRQNRRRAA